MAEDEQKLLILNQENLSLKSTIDQLTHRITELEASLLAASRPSSPIKFLKIDEEKRSISPFPIVENQAEEDKEVIQKLERANDIILKKDRKKSTPEYMLMLGQSCWVWVNCTPPLPHSTKP